MGIAGSCNSVSVVSLAAAGVGGSCIGWGSLPSPSLWPEVWAPEIGGGGAGLRPNRLGGFAGAENIK